MKTLAVVRLSAAATVLALLLSGCSASATDMSGGQSSNGAAVDIKDIVLTNMSGDCADYSESYQANVSDLRLKNKFVSVFNVSDDAASCSVSSNDIPNYDFNDDSAHFATPVAEQNIALNIPRNPKPAANSTELSLLFYSAVMLNGVVLDQVANGCYSPDDPSADADGNIANGCGQFVDWRLDPLGKVRLGTDSHNGHTQPGGLYHYHGNPMALFDPKETNQGSPVIGFAADGFPIFGPHYIDPATGEMLEAKSGYTLKTGSRPTTDGSPGGTYDGTYIQDYEFTGAGTLDECNGMTINGQYGYYVTSSYPYVMGCYTGTPDPSFMKANDFLPWIIASAVAIFSSLLLLIALVIRRRKRKNQSIERPNGPEKDKETTDMKEKPNKRKLVWIGAATAVVVVSGALWFAVDSSYTPVPLGAPGVVADKFLEGSLTDDISEEACTLTDGTETTCYRISVTGIPVDTTIGPFCPKTASSTAEESGIWLDGSKLYDADGAFILDLATIYGDAKWKLYDDKGNVNVTDTKEEFQGAARPDVQEDLKYNCVEGKYEWTNTGKAVPISMLVPKTPMKAASASTTAGTDLGVTLNGLVIAPSAPVDAILGAYTIAAFDDCGGHFNPIEGYHMHAYTDCAGADYDATIEDPNAETKQIGYALDGVAVFAPLAHDSTIELDECNGRTTDKDGYHYYAQSPELNRIVKCFKGLTAVDDTATTAQAPAGNQGGPAGQGPPDGQGPPPGGPQGGINPATLTWIIAGSVLGGGLLVAGGFGIARARAKRRANS
ncbi:MAG: hypothetical protein RI974_258 [Actinomycetota bacterium]